MIKTIAAILIIGCSPALAMDKEAAQNSAVRILMLQEGYYGANLKEVRTKIKSTQYIHGRATKCENHEGPLWQFHIVSPDPDDATKIIDGYLGLDMNGEPICVTIPFLD